MFHGMYTSTHQLVITGDDNVPTGSSHDVIILRPDLSTSYYESDNCYQALTAEREVGHGVSSGFFFYFASAPFYAKYKFSAEMFMEGNCTEDKYMFELVILFFAYVTKLIKSQTLLNKQLHFLYSNILWSATILYHD